MTSPLEPQTLSIRDLLFEAPRGTPEELNVDDRPLAAVDEKLGLLGRVGREFVAQELRRVILELVDSDVLALMGSAWRKHSTLVEAGRRTASSVGAEEHVVLATHRISSIQEPQIDLLVDGALLGTLDLKISLSLLVRGLVAVVREGRLVAVRAGSCATEASLALEDVEIARREIRFDLTSQMTLGAGVPLVPRTVVGQA